MTRTYSALLVAAFCALIAVPGTVLGIWPGPQPLPKVPEVAYPPFEASWRWLSSFDSYIAANFGHKRRLVQLHNAIGYSLLGDLQSDDVLAGRDGWLFLKQSLGWEAFRSEQPLSEEEKAGWQTALRRAQRELEARHIPFLYVIAPSKETIYPEYLPAGAKRARATTRFDEMLPVLRSAGIDYLDLRDPLLREKGNGLLYDKLESHWNGRGARVAAQAVLERAQALLARDAAYGDPNAQLSPAPSTKDLASLLALDDYLMEDSVELTARQPRARRLVPDPKIVAPRLRYGDSMIFEVPDPSLPKALILRDSFGAMLVSALSEKFRRSVWLWTRRLDFRQLDKERPDIVIFELTERMFYDGPAQLQLPRKRRR
jgi:alginate O-acetyltransferase complex protein AlgJ